MREGPPFERYPGSPGRDEASSRVISPWRDALAWVSIAGPLEVTGYLVRDAGSWRDVLPRDSTASPVGLVWSLAWRDPVELVFRTTAEGVDATARVTVTRAACEIHVSAGTDETRVLESICLPRETVVEQRDGDVLLRLVSIWIKQQ